MSLTYRTERTLPARIQREERSVRVSPFRKTSPRESTVPAAIAKNSPERMIFPRGFECRKSTLRSVPGSGRRRYQSGNPPVGQIEKTEPVTAMLRIDAVMKS